MALAQTIKFSQFLIQLGDGAAPENFASPCGLNSRGFTRTAATSDTNVPDCDDPDAPSWLERDVTSLSASLTGAGVVADEDFDTWDAWFTAATSKNVKITLGTRVWLGPMKLTSLKVSGQRGQRTTLDISLDSDGELFRQ
jgi:predicted secreted protein